MNPIIISIITLLAGVGVFIVGMNLLSEGLEKSAGGGMKKLLGHITGNRFSGVGVGAAVTAIIQSSSATSVMAIGFVNAGVMTLAQATSIIMGANIGTTVTGVLVSLSSLDISLWASLLAFVGVMMTFIKNNKVKTVGGALCGLGLIFVGLDAMSGAFGNAEIKNFFRGIFEQIDFPLLLILVGVIFTALIQSSSAATGLVIIMAGEGAIGIDAALFIVLGSNIGTCITAIIASIGAGVNAKRTAFIHLIFNVIGTVLFSAVIWIFSDFVVETLQGFISNTQMQIAWFHVVFNVTTTLVLLPFVNHLVKLAMKTVREKPTTNKLSLKFADRLLLNTPAAAIMQAKNEIDYMMTLCLENMDKSFVSIYRQDGTNGKKVHENEEIIDFTNQELTKYLIDLSSYVDKSDEKVIGSYFHVLNDLERIGDHAENFFEIGEEMKAKGLVFSDEAKGEISQMYEKLSEMFALARRAFEEEDIECLKALTSKEEEMDKLKKELSTRHYSRLAEGRCMVEHSPYYTSTITGLERVADHLVNVGYSIVNPTGSQS